MRLRLIPGSALRSGSGLAGDEEKAFRCRVLFKRFEASAAYSALAGFHLDFPKGKASFELFRHKAGLRGFRKSSLKACLCLCWFIRSMDLSNNTSRFHLRKTKTWTLTNMWYRRLLTDFSAL